MSRITLGRLVVNTARGHEKLHKVSPDQVRELNRDISEKVASKIDEIRDQQRRALEESKPIVLL